MNAHSHRTLAVLTSGGDSPGMNPAVRAVARTAIQRGCRVIGFQNGFDGIFDDNSTELTTDLLSGWLERGGTILQSSRCPRFVDPEGQKRAMKRLQERRIDGLVVIGGDGSLRGAQALDRLGFPVVGIPGTIDNDIYGTQMGVGSDTASNTILELVDRIKVTARSHRRCFLIEVMGSGYLALTTAIACGAEVAVIPEYRYNMQRILTVLEQRFTQRKNNSLIILADTACDADTFIAHMEREAGAAGLKQEVCKSVLGHIQRGGTPSSYDRLLATRMGELAVIGLLQSETGTMTALRDGRVTLIGLDQALSRRRPLPTTLVRLARNMGIEIGDTMEM